jgi:hypothetical protein
MVTEMDSAVLFETLDKVSAEFRDIEFLES